MRTVDDRTMSTHKTGREETHDSNVKTDAAAAPIQPTTAGGGDEGLMEEQEG